MNLTTEEAHALEELGNRVDEGEYVLDRVATEMTIGFVDGEPIVRGYSIEDAIGRANAWMREDIEREMGGWA